MVATIESYDAFKAATSTDKLVIIDFWATWCVLRLASPRRRRPARRADILPLSPSLSPLRACFARRCGPWYVSQSLSLPPREPRAERALLTLFLLVSLTARSSAPSLRSSSPSLRTSASSSATSTRRRCVPLSRAPLHRSCSLTPLSVARAQEVAGEVGIKAMPTFALFKNGEKVGTVVGADPNKLKAALEHHSVASA